mmetsp:Transcript_59340/g.97727  ORF Transcript_59340/g.97727 Transcript_59340/m.97727 type:complete len:87 (-) Transcript_59340:941-1201(-)
MGAWVQGMDKTRRMHCSIMSTGIVPLRLPLPAPVGESKQVTLREAKGQAARDPLAAVTRGTRNDGLRHSNGHWGRVESVKDVDLRD